MVLPETAKERMRRLGQMTMDEVAEVAAGNPGAAFVQSAEVEIRRRVAVAQIEAAEAQKAAATPLTITAWSTVLLALATLALAALTYWTLTHPAHS